MQTYIQHKKAYAIAATILFLLGANFVNAQDTLKMDDRLKDKKKKQITRIEIYKNEDGKITKVDTTIMNEHAFEMDAFVKKFNLDLIDFPDEADFPTPPEAPVPPMPPLPPLPPDNYYYYRFNTRTWGDDEREEFKKEIEHLKRSKDQFKHADKEESKKEMDKLKDQLKDLQNELDKLKKHTK